MRKNRTDWGYVGIMSIIVSFIVLLIALVLFQPYMEARAYERVTGKHVSVWDAMFLDLRVQEPMK